MDQFCENSPIPEEISISCNLKASAVKYEEAKFTALFGPSLHARSSEAYFADAPYTPTKNFAKLTHNEKGEVTDSFVYPKTSESFVHSSKSLIIGHAVKIVIRSI